MDWNPEPPDKNIGLWRGVELIRSGAVSLESPMVNTKLADETLVEAELGIRVLARNYSDIDVETELVSCQASNFG